MACIHMCGLLARLGGRWPRWLPQHEFQSPQRPCTANGSHGFARVSGRPITPNVDAPRGTRALSNLIGWLASICAASWRGLVAAGQDGFRNTSSNHRSGLVQPMGPTDLLASRVDRSLQMWTPPVAQEL